MHRRFLPAPLSRRDLLRQAANGFGAVALAALLDDRAFAGEPAPSPDRTPLAPRPPHLPAKAKSVIFLCMDGGRSRVDTSDPKPRLAKEHGQPIKVKVEPTQFNNVGNVLRSPWKFAPRGQSGTPVSDLLPHIAECADDLCVIRSMTSN